jgi:putative DNA methylase
MTYKKKLIEVALPLATINAESAREKSIRHGHPSTLHLWWARRPLAAARAVLWASLVDDPSAHPEQFPTQEEQLLERRRLFDILERLVPWEASNNENILAEARMEIEKSCDGEFPKILDPFAGGGAIPLEALRLGLPTYAGDLNPVAVIIQRAMLDIPSRFAGHPPAHPAARATRALWDSNSGLAADLEKYGTWMLGQAKRLIGKDYPDATLPDGTSATPIAWIWARTVKSPDPAWPGVVPLVRSWILAKRPGRAESWIEPVIDRQNHVIDYRIRVGGTPTTPTVAGGNGVCIATGATIAGPYIKAEAQAGRLGQVLIAVVADNNGQRVFLPPTDEARAAAISSSPKWAPRGAVPRHLTGGTCYGYGLDEWGKLYTARQLVALTTFSDLLRETQLRVEADAKRAAFSPDERPLRLGGIGSVAYAEAIKTYLAFVVDKCTDYWSTIAGWVPTGEFVNNTFGRQAIPMSWDFAEVNPFSDRGGSWMAMLQWVVRLLEGPALPRLSAVAIAQRDAAALIGEIGTCVLSTDPPYYDNISYADLSDFFYVWLRRNLGDVWPDECATLLTPKAEELIANPHRAGSKAKANEHFELGIKNVFAMAAEHADGRFPATVFYAFKATENTDDGIVSTGWETFLSGILEAGFAMTATWPLRTERSGGLKVGKGMLASSIVLALRKRQVSAPMATRGELMTALRNEMPPAIRLLQEQSIAPVDMAQSAIGPGIAVFSRYAKVVEADGSSMSVRTALALINEVLSEVLSGEESEFDADTRFALTWFEQYGHTPGPFGDADLLARAKDTTVAGVEQSGVAVSREGNVRLVERAELRDAWDPATDARLTVWETAQHMIRALESSETDAASLLRRIGGGLGERARQLAYLLYGICERKKWAEEASAYNMLVTAWPEVSRLASSTQIPTSQDTLF